MQFLPLQPNGLSKAIKDRNKIKKSSQQKWEDFLLNLISLMNFI